MQKPLSFRKSTSYLKINDLEKSFDQEEIKGKYQDALLMMRFWIYTVTSNIRNFESIYKNGSKKKINLQ